LFRHLTQHQEPDTHSKFNGSKSEGITKVTLTLGLEITKIVMSAIIALFNCKATRMAPYVRVRVRMETTSFTIE
jgi:hypothetical protein